METTIEILLSNGDRAEAEGPEAAIVAARTMMDDAVATGSSSRFLTAGFYVGGTLIREKVGRAELPSLTALLGDYVLSAEAYLALCDRARAVGVPTSLDDPDSPATVTGLREAVEAAEAEAAVIS